MDCHPARTSGVRVSRLRRPTPTSSTPWRRTTLIRCSDSTARPMEASAGRTSSTGVRRRNGRCPTTTPSPFILSKPFSVVWGGTKLYRTDDGRHWRKITSRDRGARNYVHEDHHALLWLEDDTIISGNDGGVAVSKDGGRSWEDRSRGMVTTMFYDLDVAPSNSKALAGGTQDNGTLVAGVKDREGNFFKAIAGDGAWTVFDPADSESLFASSNNFDVRWHRRGKPWDFHGWKSVSPKPEQISDEEKAQRAVTVLAIEPSTRKGSKRLYAGTARLWCTDTNGRRWRRASEVFDRSPISAIAISSVSPRVMYVGTSKGGIFRSRDGGGTWSQNLAGPDLPERAITSIQTHPKLKDTVVVTVAATGVAGSGVDIHNGGYLPYGHVFRSKDGGGIWEEIDRRELPNVAYFASAYETHPPYRLFVAGDLGVWAEVDKPLGEHQRQPAERRSVGPCLPSQGPYPHGRDLRSGCLAHASWKKTGEPTWPVRQGRARYRRLARRPGPGHPGPAHSRSCALESNGPVDRGPRAECGWISVRGQDAGLAREPD